MNRLLPFALAAFLFAPLGLVLGRAGIRPLVSPYSMAQMKQVPMR